MRASRVVVSLLASIAVAGTAVANHGPGTSGGGTSTASGETLAAGRWEAQLRLDYTQFESVSRTEAEQRALQHDEFDALDNSWLTSLGLSYGISDDFQVGATIGWYRGNDFIDAEADGLGGVESATADPTGLTDLWLNGKYRIFEHMGHLAVIAGVKLPTGKDDERLDNGEELEPSSQPGTGAYDGQLGVAYSRYLTPRLTLDASALYTLRGTHDRFTVGDRADLGLAVAWRLTEDVKSPTVWSVYGETSLVWLGKDEDDDVKNDSSGGTTLFLSAGVRARLTPTIAATIGPSFPIWEDLNGEQIETRYKVALTLSFLF